MPSISRKHLHDDDTKRLKRLKFGLWILTILFISHGLFGAFPEIYPVTRWGMYSFANGQEFELTEGYLMRWWVQVTTLDGEVHLLSDQQLAGQFRFNAASLDLIRLNMSELATSPDKAVQQASADFMLDLLTQRFGEDIQAFEIHRYAHQLDYSQFPSIDEDTPDFVDVMICLSSSGQSIDCEAEKS